MLSIGHVRAGNAAQREYHQRQLAEGRDDYYREAEGPPGRWVGSLAERLGVAGEATVEEFGRLLDGKVEGPDADAFDGAQRRKVLAFDMAFSAPKSVSLLRIAADEPTSKLIDRAHDRAVRAAFELLEREAADYNQRDGAQRRTERSSDGLVGVLYRHETTRNADPQLHSHVVAMNLVRREDGSYSSLNNRQLYRLAKTAGSVYQSVLRGELGRDLGLRFEVPVNGLADVEGFDRQLIERYSTRRAELVEALRSKGLEGAGRYAAEASALETRRAKDMQLDHAAWRQEMRHALHRDGLVPERVAELVGARADQERSLGERLGEVDVEDLADRQAHVDGRQVVQRGLDTPEGIGAEEVQEAIDRILADDRLARVQSGSPTDLGSQRFTTRRHLELEQEVSGLTVGRSEHDDPRVPAIAPAEAQRLRDELPSPVQLTAAQERVADELLTSGRGFEVVTARAGAGKTTVAGVVRSRFEAAGYDVVGLAPTHQAVAEMRDTGIGQLETLARASYQDGQFSQIVQRLGPQSVVLIDEAGMAQTRQVAPLLQRAQAVGAKVVAIGDDRQLAAVGAGGWFRHAVEHEASTPLRLGEVHRQRGGSYEEGQIERSRLGLLHDGNAGPWLRWAERTGRLGITDTVEDGYREVVERFRDGLDADHGIDDVAVLVPTNAHRRELNAQLRRELVDRDLLCTDGQRDLRGQLVTPGDRMISSRNVRDDTGRELVRNGERFTIEAVGKREVRAVATAGHREGQTVRLPAELLGGAAPTIEHAYARTVHKAQGITTQRVVVFAPRIDGLSSNLAYVALSRTRARTDLVAVGNERDQVLDRLQQRLQQRADHQMAWSLLEHERLRPSGGLSRQDLEEHREALMHELVDAGNQVQQHQARQAARAEANQARVRAAGLASRRDQRAEKLAELLLDITASRQEAREDLAAGRRPSMMGWGPGGGDDVLRSVLDDVVDLDRQITDNQRGPIEETPAHLRRVEQVHRELLVDLADVDDRLAGERRLTREQRRTLHELPEGARQLQRDAWIRQEALELDVEAAGRLAATGDRQLASWLRDRVEDHERAIDRAQRQLHPGRATPQRPDADERVPGWQHELVDLARHARSAGDALDRFLREQPVDLERIEAARQRAGLIADQIGPLEQRLEDLEQQRPALRGRRDWQRSCDALRADLDQLRGRHAHEVQQLDRLLDGHDVDVDALLERRDALRTVAARTAQDAAEPRQRTIAAIRTGQWRRAQHPAVYRGLGERPAAPATGRRWDELAARITDRQIERAAGGNPERVQPAAALRRAVEAYRRDVSGTRGPDRGPGRNDPGPSR